MAGYSGTPLVKKLGIKDGFRVAFVGAPPDYADTLGPLPAAVTVLKQPKAPMDFIQLFVKSHVELEKLFVRMSRELAPAGMLWISWPKKTSGVTTDLHENLIRDIGLAAGLVDVKVCAVDETWSGLKFVIRVKDRPGGDAPLVGPRLL